MIKQSHGCLCELSWNVRTGVVYHFSSGRAKLAGTRSVLAWTATGRGAVFFSALGICISTKLHRGLGSTNSRNDVRSVRVCKLRKIGPCIMIGEYSQQYPRRSTSLLGTGKVAICGSILPSRAPELNPLERLCVARKSFRALNDGNEVTRGLDQNSASAPIQNVSAI